MFDKLFCGKTCIYISHRLACTKLIDRIVVFENAKLIEDGTHQELLNLHGKYFELFNMQAQGSNVDCKDDFYMVKDFLLSMTDNDWKFKQIVIPFDEKKGIYCTLGYEVIFERKK